MSLISGISKILQTNYQLFSILVLQVLRLVLSPEQLLDLLLSLIEALQHVNTLYAFLVHLLYLP